MAARDFADVVATVVGDVGERFTRYGKISPCALVFAPSPGSRIHVVAMDAIEDFAERVRREAEMTDAEAVAIVREAWVSKPGAPSERIEAIVVYVEAPSGCVELVCPIVKDALFPMLAPAVEVPKTAEVSGFFAPAPAVDAPPSERTLE